MTIMNKVSPSPSPLLMKNEGALLLAGAGAVTWTLVVDKVVPGAGLGLPVGRSLG